MIETVIRLAKLLVCTLPFILFALLNTKANLKRQHRSHQFLMPVVALVYCIILSILLNLVNGWVISLLNWLPSLLERGAEYLYTALGGVLAVVGNLLSTLAELLENLLKKVNPVYLLLFVSNALFMLVHVILKRILVTIMKAVFKSGGDVHELCTGAFYEKDEESGLWHIRDHFSQARTFLKTVYFAALILSVIALIVSCELYREGMLAVPFYPVFGVIVIGEMYFFLDGLNRREMDELLTGEADRANQISNYVLLRQALKKLFEDKLGADGTTVDGGMQKSYTNDEVLHEMEESDDVKIEAYGRFMRIKHRNGLELDHNYLASGLELLKGNSILFNDPFYYDLIPYAFYPMNRTLLCRKKVLIILGRHDVETDIETWCSDGLMAVTNVPAMWKIGVLSDSKQELDVGIVTRSSVHDLALHEANAEFFREVEFVVIIEPSKLVSTAQIGLNSLVRHCRQEGKQITFCSTDKNCDGLVDSLSHLLQANLTEVAATNHHKGTSSYMCWETDGEHLQHRLLPNLSRYLGMGTELSFAALKNQVSETEWYGGEVFPVKDIHWIAKQYYYDLLRYADLPVTQETMDKCFKVSSNIWNAKVKDDHYLTVEDEACNMFELRRDFATRAKNQGFINIISPEYLLKDYMLGNEAIFNADPKAIPYIVADYAATPRNVILRLCLRMSAGAVSEEDIRRELMLIDIEAGNLAVTLWHQICLCCSNVGSSVIDKIGDEHLEIVRDGVVTSFGMETLRTKRRFSLERGTMDTMYFITDTRFIDLLLGDLQNAGYIAEDEKGEKQYLGTELRGHIFQKYLPGQFFTFGGKYYEMLRVTSSGQVLVRRAADHITGRPAYRQVRNYYLSSAVDSTVMGDSKDIAGLHITKQYADLRVETPAYWQMETYNDFAGAHKVSINGVPDRVYRSKQILRIDLPNENGKLTREICSTITLLFNEIFRTLFAENHAFIAAVLPGDTETPATYSVQGENGFEPGTNSIYIIEDSQLDLGLLVAVQRNLNRMFGMICDYLDWHIKAVETSLNPPAEPEAPDYTLDPAAQEEKPQGKLKKAFKKIGGFFKKIGEKVGGFFGKLFKKKAKQEVDQEDGADIADYTDEPVCEPDYDAPEPVETVEEVPESTDDAEEFEEADEEETDLPETEEDAEESRMSFMSVSGETVETVAADVPVEMSDEDKDTLTFEPVTATDASANVISRKPYHERYYLLYGGTQVPAQIDVEGTLDFLNAIGFRNNELKQAREKTDIAELIEKDGLSNLQGGRACDFCGVELIGTEYEVLSDGRDRCKQCSKTAVKTEAEFREIYKNVVRNLETFYSAKITAPIKVEMVNAKKLHKKLGKSFVPTGNCDGRVLGVAIKSKTGYSILVENGAPRMQSTLTMAHELIHIWQYLNWDQKAILKTYGKAQELEVYEGMAKWGEIQYAYLIGESATAKREEIATRLRQDEYGRGFCKYLAKYPLSTEIQLAGVTPFSDKERPL